MPSPAGSWNPPTVWGRRRVNLYLFSASRVVARRWWSRSFPATLASTLRGELRLARRSLESIPAALGRSETPLECVPRLELAAIRQIAEQHLAWLTELGGGSVDRIVDKMPVNYVHLGLLATPISEGPPSSTVAERCVT